MMKSCTSKFLNFNKAGPPSYNFRFKENSPQQIFEGLLRKGYQT